MFKLLGNPMLDEMLGGDPEASQLDPRVPIDDKPWQERMEAGEIPVVYGPREAPLTDEELARAAAVLEIGTDLPPSVQARLVAEDQRLRSDEWLRAAVEAYYGAHPDPEIAGQRERLFECLRKHRDGR